MKAVVMAAAGPADTLKLVDMIEPGITSPDQVKVRLKAAGVNPVDTKLRSRGVFYPDGLPAVLGCDGAGVITEVGDQVKSFSPGEEVWFCNGGLGGEQGNYAEYTVVSQDVVSLKPSGISFEQAAAGPLVLITAWEALFDRARLRKGQTVLIHGGTGGVGHVAVQLAREAGARVCTTVGSRDKIEAAEALGAEKVIVYSEEDFVEQVNAWTGGRGVDAALDIMGGEVLQRTFQAVAHYGDVVTLLSPDADTDWTEARNRNLRFGFELMLTPMLRDLPEARRHHREILDECSRGLAAGELRLDVNDVLPLAQAAEAHRRIETGHTRGKIVLRCAD